MVSESDPAKLNSLFLALNQQFGSRARLNEPLAKHTTLRLGGPADIWLPVKTSAELVEAVTLARHHKISPFILGGGANLLISQAGIRGLVIENRANAVQFTTDGVVAESGAVIPRLAKQCAQRSLSGFEWAGGIPGTIGGAVVNNAGAYGASIANNLRRAELLNVSGERNWYPVSWFNYQYRTSKLKQQTTCDYVVLSAELTLQPALREEIEVKMNDLNERRKKSQPPGATIGSMFKNPPGDYAGRLIETAGLKGVQIGQAQISPVHANFFSNLGGANADEVIQLIKTAQKTVFEQFGIQLELEIEIT